MSFHVHHLLIKNPSQKLWHLIFQYTCHYHQKMSLSPSWECRSQTGVRCCILLCKKLKYKNLRHSYAYWIVLSLKLSNFVIQTSLQNKNRIAKVNKGIYPVAGQICLIPQGANGVKNKQYLRSYGIYLIKSSDVGKAPGVWATFPKFIKILFRAKPPTVENSYFYIISIYSLYCYN